MPVTFCQTECANLPDALKREWLDTNGAGGYASGTICNCHTRKYHGLLAATLQQPAGTFMLLSHYEDYLHIGDEKYALVTHRYGDNYFPDGHVRQTAFEQELLPSFTYACGNAQVVRQVMMLQGRNAVLVRYEIQGACKEATLRLRPLLAYRSIHQLTHANGALRVQTEGLPSGFRVHPYDGMPPLTVQASLKSTLVYEPVWYYNVSYPLDAERGFEHREDLFSPGVLEIKLKGGQAVIVAASVPAPLASPVRAWDQELARRQQARDNETVPPAIRKAKPPVGELYALLRHAARQLLMELPGDVSAIHAGYHWFGPWGRDTLLALPGLLFTSGQLELGAKILRAVAGSERKGLLPNFLNPDGTGAYTAADPALWFFWTVQQYVQAGGDLQVVRDEFWPTMLSIIRHYQRGTGNGIVADADGLIRAGTPATAVTWMDAQVGGRPIIARFGYMVEINTLWYNAISFALELARKTFSECIEDLDSDYVLTVKQAFVHKFWLADQKILLDTVNESAVDNSLRPNQLFAISLPYSPLSLPQQKAVLAVVKRELFTPRGLRSLGPHDIRYHPYCQGENWVRELAYHQGSVWPWFVAHFAEALLRIEGNTAASRSLLGTAVEAFAAHVREAGVGSVSEVFDGDPPHAPRGAISQAWNVGEVLRFLTLYAAAAK